MNKLHLFGTYSLRYGPVREHLGDLEHRTGAPLRQYLFSYCDVQPGLHNTGVYPEHSKGGQLIEIFFKVSN